MTEEYTALVRQLQALIQDVPFQISNLSNAAALLWQTLPQINWVGFYRLMGEKLVLYPFQGKPACIEIPVGKGVCGTAVREERCMRVDDVHRFPGHIACDGASNSELVIPLMDGDSIWGVLDIDSPVYSRFSNGDEEGLKQIAQILSRMITETNK
jgi:L-methionine (R)-S-oxide reductase